MNKFDYICPVCGQKSCNFVEDTSYCECSNCGVKVPYNYFHDKIFKMENGQDVCICSTCSKYAKYGGITFMEKEFKISFKCNENHITNFTSEINKINLV